MLVENSEAGISARQTRQRQVEDLTVSQLGYLATEQAGAAQVLPSYRKDCSAQVLPTYGKGLRSSGTTWLQKRLG